MELIRVVDEDGNDTDEVLEREDVHDLSKLHNEVTIYIINEVHVLCNKYLVLEDENNHFMYPYYVITDLEEDDFIIQKEEVSYVKWHNIDDVINLIEVGDKEVVFKKEEIYLFRMLKDIVS